MKKKSSSKGYELIGQKKADRNIKGNILIMETKNTWYSFPAKDIIEERKVENGMTLFLINKKGKGLRIEPFGLTNNSISMDKEELTSPQRIYDLEKIKFANENDIKNIKQKELAADSLAAVAKFWSNSCVRGESEKNNCAHFLSDAFIRAGYTDLTKSGGSPHITEWCDWDDTPKQSIARTIRAKEMWKWFESKAKRSLRTKPVKDGFWAVFQWDKTYSGGHVLLYDSNKNVVYGTGVYWNWSDQYFYQW